MNPVWMRRLDEPDVVRIIRESDVSEPAFIDVPVADLVKMVATDPVLRAAVMAALLPLTPRDVSPDRRFMQEGK